MKVMKDSISIGYWKVREGRRMRAGASVEVRGRSAVVFVMVSSLALLAFALGGGWLP